MKSLISVIVPCFNAEKYIERCLDSILKQTYRNIEVIVVDDDSTDDSAVRIKEISKLDNRVKYVYQKNAGVSAARNRGLDEAKGDKITFVDSDDTISPEMYQVLVSLMEQYEADISHCSYLRNVNGELKYIGNTNQIYCSENDEVVLSLLEAKLIVPSCCNKLFKKEIINNIRFDTNIRINEDLLFDFLVFQKAKKSVFIDSCFYTYYTADTSSCINTNQRKTVMDGYRVSEIIYQKSHGYVYEKLAKQRFLEQHLTVYWYLINSNEASDKQQIIQLKKRIIRAYNSQELSSSARKKAFLIKYSSFIYKPVVNIHNRIRKPNWDL